MRFRERLVPGYGTMELGKLEMYYSTPPRWVLLKTYTHNPTSLGRNYRSIERCYDELHSGPPYRSGGPFQKWTMRDQGMELSGDHVIYNVARTWRYTGGFICTTRPTLIHSSDVYNIGQEGYSEDGFGDVSSWGPTGWSRFRPGNPTADANVFLGELREVPRMLMATAKFFRDAWKMAGGNHGSFGPKHVADQWLNTQFGWLPFLNDLRKFYYTYTNLDRKLKHIIQGNGKWQKRAGTLRNGEEEISIVKETAYTAHAPTLYSTFYPNPTVSGTAKHSEVTSERIWFEGSFRYWIPDIGSVQWKKRAVRQLFGLEVTPSLLWELTPFSWLCDWFTNFGDVIDGASVGWADNLAAKYAYVMGTTRRVYRVESVHALHNPIHTTWEYPIERKSRVPAGPFGFGLTTDDLSSRQWSILAALGLSRQRILAR